MRASSLVRFPRGLLPLTLAAGMLMAPAVFASPASAAEEFGIEPGSFTASVNNEDGSSDTQAGSHPYSASTSFEFTYHLIAKVKDTRRGEPKDIVVELPSGFAGNPNVTPRCTNTQLEDLPEPSKVQGW